MSIKGFGNALLAACLSLIFSYLLLNHLEIWENLSAFLNWERLLHFVHINRLGEDQTIADIRLQKLPGLLPLYPLSAIFQQASWIEPLQRIQWLMTTNYAIILLLKSAICFALTRKKRPLYQWLIVLTALEFTLINISVAYHAFSFQAAKLSHHGDSTLIIILTTIYFLCEVYNHLNKPKQNARQVTNLVFGVAIIFGFAGAVTSSLYIVQITVPLVTLICFRLIRRTRHFPANQYFQKSIECLNSKRNELGIILGSVLGYGAIKTLLNSNCTPAFVGDWNYFSSLFEGLINGNNNIDSRFYIDSSIGLTLISTILASSSYVKSCKLNNDDNHVQGQKQIALLFFALSLSAPLVLGICALTAFGDARVFLRYGLYYVSAIPLLIVLSIEVGRINIEKVNFRHTLIISIFLISLLGVQGATESKYISYVNPLIKEIELFSLEQGSKSSQNKINILVAEDENDYCCDRNLDVGVLEYLSENRFRVSRLAALSAPRLYDQSAEEFVHTNMPIRSQTKSQELIRDFPVVVTKPEYVESIIKKLGDPNLSKKIFLNDRKDASYELLWYAKSNQSTMKNYFYGYIVPNHSYYESNEFCYQGDGFTGSLKNLLSR